MNASKILLFAALLLLSSAAIAQVTDAQLVENAFPSELSASSDTDSSSRFYTFVTADLNQNGQVLIIALYSNGTRAAVSVLDRSGRIVSHPVLPFLKGFRGELELVDFDGDGVPEIIVRLESGHGLPVPDSWVFAWRAGGLSLISPTAPAHDLTVTLLSQIAAIDLDGSGKLSLLAFPGVRRDDDSRLVAYGDGIVYSLVNGRFAPSGTTFTYAASFFRHTASPSAVVKHFSGPVGPKVLRVVNGVSRGINVDSATVTLNGTVVARPSNFKPGVHVIDIPVQLLTENTLRVELTGKPGAGIWVLITASP